MQITLGNIIYIPNGQFFDRVLIGYDLKRERLARIPKNEAPVDVQKSALGYGRKRIGTDNPMN